MSITRLQPLVQIRVCSHAHSARQKLSSRASCNNEVVSITICGKAVAAGPALVRVRQGCPLSPAPFGLFFDNTCSQLQTECPSAGFEYLGPCIPSLFYADDVALLSALAQHLQLLDIRMACRSLIVSIPKAEVVVPCMHLNALVKLGQDPKQIQSLYPARVQTSSIPIKPA